MREPEEFRYWENVQKPSVRRARRLAQAFGFDLTLPDDVVRTLGAMYYDADPLAEAFVEAVYFTRGLASSRGPRPRSASTPFDAGRAMLDTALAHGVGAVQDAPPSLVALFADIEHDPPWLDQAQVELGARTFRRYGCDVFRFAGAITLMAYAENSVAKPLALTGAYAGDSTRHRFLETASFWIDVSEPGGTRPMSRGRAAALRVRIMHVFVRRRLLAHPEWNAEAWGLPINQADALLTLMGGSVAPGLAMHAMGYRASRAEIEAMMHFWRYVGHLMGVRPRWYPHDIAEALQLLFVTMLKGANGAGEDGKKLCQSYANAFQPSREETPLRRLLSHIHDGVHRGTTRFFTPPWIQRRMDMPGAGLWALYPLALFPAIFTAETLRRRVPWLDEVADRVARRSRNRWLARQRGEREAAFRPVSAFTR